MLLITDTNSIIFVITNCSEYKNKCFLFDASSGISCLESNDRYGSEKFVQLNASELLNEVTEFNPKFGKRRIRIIEMNLERNLCVTI
jgi:hypothetical protein